MGLVASVHSLLQLFFCLLNLIQGFYHGRYWCVYSVFSVLSHPGGALIRISTFSFLHNSIDLFQMVSGRRRIGEKTMTQILLKARSVSNLLLLVAFFRKLVRNLPRQPEKHVSVYHSYAWSSGLLKWCFNKHRLLMFTLNKKNPKKQKPNQPVHRIKNWSFPTYSNYSMIWGKGVKLL